MANVVPPNINILYDQLELLRVEVVEAIKADEGVLDNKIVDYGIDYDPWDKDYNFPDLSILLETLLYGNLLEYAFELGLELDERIIKLENEKKLGGDTQIEIEETEEIPKRILH